MGWENGPGEFKRFGNAVPDEVLAMLPEADLVAIGNDVLGMMAELGKAVALPAPEPATPASPAPAEPTSVTDLAKARRGRARKGKPS